MKMRWTLGLIVATVCITVIMLVIQPFIQSPSGTNTKEDLQKDPDQPVFPTDVSGNAERPVADYSFSAKGKLNQQSNHEKNSPFKSVQLKPLRSAPVQNLLSSAWSRDKNSGLRMVHDPESSSLGPIAIRLINGKIFVVDEADGRLVHTDASGRIVESVNLPVRNPQQVHVGDDGQLLVWDPTDANVIQKSKLNPDKSEQTTENSQWEKIPLPTVPDTISQTQMAVHPSRLFHFKGNSYAENQYGLLHLLGKPTGPVQMTLPGRPTANPDLFVRVMRGHPKDGGIFVQAIHSGGELVWERKLEIAGRDPHVLALESSPMMDFVVIAWEAGRSGQTGENRFTLCAKVSLSGDVVSVLELPRTLHDGLDIRDPILVDDKNTFLHMIVKRTGIAIDRHAWEQ